MSKVPAFKQVLYPSERSILENLPMQGGRTILGMVSVLHGQPRHFNYTVCMYYTSSSLPFSKGEIGADQ